MSTKTYSIYVIWNTINNKYYIGITKQAIRTRVLAHYNSLTNEELYNDMHKLGKDNFKYKALEKNIETQEEARDLEQKYILQYKQNYQVYNLDLSGYKHHFICIETNEEFTTIQEACNKYAINNKDLYHALYSKNNNDFSTKSNNKILFLQNKEIVFHSQHEGAKLHSQGEEVKLHSQSEAISLHWKSLIQKTKNSVYQVYLISQLINNKWIPIYIGQTCKKLQTRLQQHKQGPSAIYDILNTYPKDNFKIEALHTQLSKEEANILERQETINYSSKYKLYNKHIETLHITKPNREGKTYINLKKLNDLSLLVNNNQILKNNYYSIYLLEYKGKKIALIVTNYSIQFINEAIAQDDNCIEIIKFLNKIDIRYGTFNIIKDNLPTYEEAIQWKQQYMQDYNMQKLIVDDTLFYQASNQRIKKGRPIIDQAKSDSLKRAWQRPETREKHLKATGFKKAVKCLDTGEIFESLAAACRKYDLVKDSLFRNITGNAKHVLSHNLNKKLHFEYVDSNNTNKNMIQQNTYSVFIILCKNIPCGIAISSSNHTEILNRYKNRFVALKSFIQQEGYENFSLQLVQNNIANQQDAKLIKQQTHDKLVSQGYKILTKR